MEALAHTCTPMCDRFQECLCNVRGMNVMNGLQPEIRQRQFFAPRNPRKHFRVEMPRRIQRRIPRTYDMSGMENRRRKATLSRLLQKICLDSRFLNAILTKRTTRLILCRRNLCAVSVNPDRAAV